MTASTDVPYGTLDPLVLKTLRTLGPLHGYGVARRIEQMARGILSLNQGTIYPALLRLEQQGLIAELVGHERQQPPGEVLRDHARRREASVGRGYASGRG